MDSFVIQKQGVIQELWIYPVKACRGVSVESCQMTPFGLEFDRAWCLVDCDGTNVAKLEAISQRKMPVLATVAVAFSSDRQQLLLDAPGMDQLVVPTALEGYSEEKDVTVENCGRSTTSGDGWSFGFMQGKCHEAASIWISKYLNGALHTGGNKLVSGFEKPASYAFVRSVTGLALADYPPVLPMIARSKTDPAYGRDFGGNGNAKRFADLAPVLLVNQASASWLGEQCKQENGQRMDGDYPIGSFRGNVVVGGSAKAWEEETWKQIAILRSSGEASGITMRKIKESARCTVPCRDQSTGGWLFPKNMLQFWKVYGKAFPLKTKDPDWGSWAGPFFGIYVGYGRQEGTLYVGDLIEVSETCSWDDHLRGQCDPRWTIGVGAVLAMTLVTAAAWTRVRAR